MNLNNEKGAVLITMLLLLIVITLVGIIAINVSTVDIQIARYTRESSTAFGGAEAGVEVAIPVIESALESGTLSISAPVTGYDAVELYQEIDPTEPAYENNPDTPDSPDITINDINGVEVEVDIDRLYQYTLPGSSVGFALGYEGAGSSSTGARATLYRIDSRGTR